MKHTPGTLPTLATPDADDEAPADRRHAHPCSRHSLPTREDLRARCVYRLRSAHTELSAALGCATAWETRSATHAAILLVESALAAIEAP